MASRSVLECGGCDAALGGAVGFRSRWGLAKSGVVTLSGFCHRTPKRCRAAGKGFSGGGGLEADLLLGVADELGESWVGRFEGAGTIPEIEGLLVVLVVEIESTEDDVGGVVLGVGFEDAVKQGGSVPNAAKTDDGDGLLVEDVDVFGGFGGAFGEGFVLVGGLLVVFEPVVDQHEVQIGDFVFGLELFGSLKGMDRLVIAGDSGVFGAEVVPSAVGGGALGGGVLPEEHGSGPDVVAHPGGEAETEDEEAGEARCEVGQTLKGGESLTGEIQPGDEGDEDAEGGEVGAVLGDEVWQRD